MVASESRFSFPSPIEKEVDVLLDLHYPSAQLPRRDLVVSVRGPHENVAFVESLLYLEHIRVTRSVHKQKIHFPLLACKRVLYSCF